MYGKLVLLHKETGNDLLPADFNLREVKWGGLCSCRWQQRYLQWPRPLRPAVWREPCPHWSSGSWWGLRCSSSRSGEGWASSHHHTGRRTFPIGTSRTSPHAWRPSPRWAQRRPFATTSCVWCSSRRQCWRKLCRSSSSRSEHRRHRTGYQQYRVTLDTDLEHHQVISKLLHSTLTQENLR